MIATLFRRRAWRGILKGLLTLVVLLLLAAGGFAWWLWGWRVGGLTFHESWTPEQRADLQAMADRVKKIADDAVNRKNDELNNLMGSPSTLQELVELRPTLARTYSELKRTAAEGKAPEHDEIAFPMTYLAARVGKPALARELVSRGDDPNNAYFSDSIRESSFQAAIACMPFELNSKNSVPIPVRQALLEHMLAHGAQQSIPQPMGDNHAITSATYAIISAMRGDKGAMAEWLLEHGYKVNTAQDRLLFAIMLSSGEGTLPAVRRIVEKYYGELNDLDRYTLLHHSLSLAPDTVEKVRWALEELHADPNAERPEQNDDIYLRASAMQTFCSEELSVLTILPEEGAADLKEQHRQRLEILDLLLSHGGKMDGNPRAYMPADAALREEYIKIMVKHGISLLSDAPLNTPQ